MHKYLAAIRKKAAENPKRIVFPDGKDQRVLKARDEIIKEKIAIPILLGEDHDPETSDWISEFAVEYQKLRAHKGISLEEATETVKKPNYFGTMMVHMGYADGMVTGTTDSTATSIRPALEILRVKEQFHKVSGIFFMIMEERLLLFADTAVTVEPTPEELAHIAIDSAETAKKFGISPKIALLSFSTFSSADHPEVDEIKETLRIVREKRPDLIIDGEMQVDAALVPSVAKIKCPKSQIQGDANILIFPNLEAANIAYKLVERLAKAQAIGPLLQGLSKPVNDLSRGCNYHDIVNVTAFTACDCIE